jgi:thiol-disulfide isomerase/thioredoxin
MRKSFAQIIAVLLMITSVSACAQAKTGTIKGVLKNAQVYPVVYLYKMLGGEIVKIDSVQHTNGAFEIKPKQALPRGFYKVGVDDKINYTFVYDNNGVVLEADVQRPGEVVYKGSKENELYKEYLNINAWHSQEFQKLDNKAQGVMELRFSDPATFNTEISKLQVQLDTINGDLRKKLIKLSSANKGTFMAKVATMFVSEDTTTAPYFFKKDEFSDEEYSRGDMLTNKIYIYLQRYHGQGDIKPACQQILARFEKNNANKEVAYLALIKGIYQQDQEYARTLAELYAKDFPTSTHAQFYLKVIPKGMPKVGDVPPDIKMKNGSGKEYSLYALRGKVVLLDFWASWCGPCRRENPVVVAAYQKYKDKGFTVFSVSLDNNKDQWLAAIQKDQLTWEYHVSDLKGWSSDVAKEYGVRGIPAAFLLDRNGKIVATNLRGAELENALEKILNQ